MSKHTSATLRFEELKVGQSADFEVDITPDLVHQFVALSGDANPLHVDESYAARTEFGETIVHGMLGAIFFSRLIGMHLPGKHALYLSQQVSFHRPIRIGMTVTVSGSIIQLVSSMRTAKIATRVVEKRTSRRLIDGEAIVKLLS